MRKTKLFTSLLLAVVTAFTIGCAKDDETCNLDNYTGVWSGSAACDSTSTNTLNLEFYTLSGALYVKYQGSDLIVDNSNCSFTAEGAFGSFSYDISGDLSEGVMDVTVIEYGMVNLEITDHCTATLTK